MAKAVTLKDKDGNELYPVTSLDLVVGAGEWVYLGGTKTTNSTTSTLDYSFPQPYDCYRIMVSATAPSGVSTNTLYLRWLNGGSVISPIDVQVLDWTNATPYPAYYGDQNYFAHTDMSEYGRMNAEVQTYLSASTDWRMVWTRMNVINTNLHIRLFNATVKTTAIPTGIRMTTGNKLGTGSFIKVWGCNKP